MLFLFQPGEYCIECISEVMYYTLWDWLQSISDSFCFNPFFSVARASQMSSILLSSPVGIFMIIELFHQAHYLYLFHIDLWPWLHLVLSCIEKPVCLFVCFPVPESNSFMKKNYAVSSVFRCVVAAPCLRPVICRGSSCLHSAVFGPWPEYWSLWCTLLWCALLCLWNETWHLWGLRPCRSSGEEMWCCQGVVMIFLGRDILLGLRQVWLRGQYHSITEGWGMV